jgi:hypothetical protein
VKILSEMPYLKVGKNKSLFDMELENFKKSKDLLNYIKDIFEGKIEKDKYGNVLQINSHDDAKALAADIKNNSFIYGAIIAKISPEEKKILDSILNF